MIIEQQGPFAPVVTPASYRQSDVGVPLFGETEEERERRVSDEALTVSVIDDRLVAKKRFLLFGLAGVALGAVVTGGMTALAMSSYRRSGSIAGPAIYAGIGSAAMGTAMVLIISRAIAGETVDPRVAAIAVGARLAS